MTKKASKGGDKSPRPPRRGKNVNVWVRPDLADVLDAYLNTARPEPTLTAVIEAALEVYFSELDLWPSPPADPED